DRTMWVDGITGPRTAGYHPLPAKPTLAIADEVAATGPFSTIASGAYLVETNILTRGDAGVIAWYVDEQNYARVGIDSQAREWYLTTVIGGEVATERHDLPASFITGVYHPLRVERCGSDLKVEIDGIDAPGRSHLAGVVPDGKAVAGLFDASGDEARFEGTIYTVGFDDLSFTLGSGDEKLLGEAAEDYELSFQLYGTDRGRKAGFYPAYADSRNYVRATIDGDAASLLIEVVERGKVVKNHTLPLAEHTMAYPDVKYSDGMEKVYRFDSPRRLNAIELSRHDADHHSEFVDNMFRFLDVAYLADGEWHSIDSSGATVASRPGYNRLELPEVKAEALRFINSNPTDTRRHIYKVGVGAALRGSYNLRTVRSGSELHLWLNGKEQCTIDLRKMPASRVGLTGSNYFADYRGVMYYLR
ncbi:MAG: glycoside hydrolase, partial [Bacteroidales bacterium]|nr:glycoside hydrolase [Bacteroidales bacterium]